MDPAVNRSCHRKRRRDMFRLSKLDYVGNIYPTTFQSYPVLVRNSSTDMFCIEKERVISSTIKAFGHLSSQDIALYQVVKVCKALDKFRHMSDDNEFKNFAALCREKFPLSKNVKVVPSSDHSSEHVASASSEPVVASASSEPVVASASSEPVVASASSESVVASASSEPVVAWAVVYFRVSLDPSAHFKRNLYCTHLFLS